jgi:choline dehydrogenase-like flavoprotein
MSIGGFRLAREITAQPAFCPCRRAERLPDPEARSDGQVLAHAGRHGETDYPPVGTCEMGVDAPTLVNPELKVRGLERLRVCDSSIMPRLGSSNTNVPTLTIGEKPADLIRAIGRPAQTMPKRRRALPADAGGCRQRLWRSRAARGIRS